MEINNKLFGSRNRARFLATACALSALIIATISPTLPGPAAAVRSKIILFTLMRCKVRAEHTSVETDGVTVRGFRLTEAYPDSLTTVQDPTPNGFTGCLENEGNTYVFNKTSTLYPHYGTIGFLDRYLYGIWGVKSMNEQFISKFKQEFGVTPLKPSIATANGSKWLQWSGPAVELVFAKYYARPTGSFHQLSYQLVYDTTVKDYASQYVNLLNHVLVTKRELWNQLCTQYAQDARTKPRFDGSTANALAAEKLFSAAELAKYPAIKSYMYIPVGQLMRRQCDGSLPTIIKCFKTILRDYDPAALQRLRVK